MTYEELYERLEKYECPECGHPPHKNRPISVNSEIVVGQCPSLVWKGAAEAGASWCHCIRL